MSAIPTGHFLSLPPSFASTSSSPPTTSHLSAGLAPNVASLASADFDVDVRTGFLPASKNLQRLPAPHDIWEDALEAAKGMRLQCGERERLWRLGVEKMLVLDIQALQESIILLRRAHVVLAFLAHFYIHTTPSPPPRPIPIPASISKPLLTVSPLLGLPPVVTYADTVLWNFQTQQPGLPSMRNPPAASLVTFTGTSSEEQFYLISALCEVAGSDALGLMRQSLDELFLADEIAMRRLSVYLRKLAAQIDRIGDITLSMIQRVDPGEFYHLIRPWFKGGDSDGPSSAGWLYEGTDGVTLPGENPDRAGAGRQYSGPSAGQSSLIHAIDIFLSVDHRPDNAEMMLNHEPIGGGSSVSNETTFVQRMLQYMPQPHRSFLLHLSTHPNPLRPIVVQHASTHPKLAESYDSALAALKRFREKHMRIVSLYIVQQARQPPNARVQALLGSCGSSSVEVESLGEMRGTGGTPLFRFLKRCRNATTGAMINQQSAAGLPGFDLDS